MPRLSGVLARALLVGTILSGVVSPPVVAPTVYPVTDLGRVALTATPTASPTNATSVANLTNMAANKADALLALTANTTHTFTTTVGAGTGRVLVLYSTVQNDAGNTIAPTMTVTGSIDGGTTQTNLAVLDGVSIDRGLIYTIPDNASASTLITVTAANKATAQGLYKGVRQLPADPTARVGVYSVNGTSYIEYYWQPAPMIAAIKAVNSAADPIILQIGKVGATTAEVRAQVVNAVNANSFAIRRGVTLVDMGGNNYLTLRPYSANSTNANVTRIATDQQAIADAVRSVSSMDAIYMGTSWRNYAANPAVNDNANPENGSQPFNVNVAYPGLMTTAPGSMDQLLKIPYWDVFGVTLSRWREMLYNPQGDGVHLPTTGPAIGFLRIFHAQIMNWLFYGGTRPVSFYEQAVAKLEATPSVDNRNRAQELVTSLPSSSAKDAFQARINAVAVPADTTQDILINFFDAQTAPNIYGATHADQSKQRGGTATSFPILNQNNKPSGFTVEYAPYASRGGTLGATGGVLDDRIQGSYAYADSATVSTETSLGFRIRGPANAVIPAIDIMSSRSGAGTDNVQWSVNGVSVTVNARGNTSTFASFTNVALNASGYVDFVCTPSGSGKTFDWLNAVRGRIPVAA